jgi:hypothetical protein
MIEALDHADAAESCPVPHRRARGYKRGYACSEILADPSEPHRRARGYKRGYACSEILDDPSDHGMAAYILQPLDTIP